MQSLRLSSYAIVVLSVAIQYALLFSKFERGVWRDLDTVTLVACSVTLVAMTIATLKACRVAKVD